MDRYYDEDGYIHYDGYTFADDEDDYLQYLEAENSYLSSRQSDDDTSKPMVKRRETEVNSMETEYERRLKMRHAAFESREKWNEYLEKFEDGEQKYDKDRYYDYWKFFIIGRLHLEKVVSDEELINCGQKILHDMDKVRKYFNTPAWKSLHEYTSYDQAMYHLEVEMRYFDEDYPEFLREEKIKLFHKWVFEGILPDLTEDDIIGMPF